MIAVTGCADSGHKGDQSMPDQELQRAMLTVRTERTYFGHQSVGANVIAGLKSLYASTNDANLHFLTLSDSPLPAGGVLIESRIGTNMNPESKCKAFTKAVERLHGDSIDIAMMKFCYVDFMRETDVQKVLGLYTETIDRLKKEFPAVTFVHVTAPLTARTPWWKKIAKRLLGRTERSDIENAWRNEFNSLLLEKFGNEPVFDLAKTESTYPDGKRCFFEIDGKTAYSLIPAYTDDGAHLNPAGGRIAAAALVQTLASAAAHRSR
jgi:hypothetical protein